MEGKLIKFSSKEECMWELKLDERKMEILQDVLEAHLEHLVDLYNDGDDEVDEEIRHVRTMLGLIYMEVEDETN